MRRSGWLAALALLAAAPAVADVPPPNLNLREFDVGHWRLSCNIDHSAGTLRDCTLGAQFGTTSIFVNGANGGLQYHLLRSCTTLASYDKASRLGMVEIVPIERTVMWRDLLALEALPLDPKCAGAQRGIDGNYTADAETALALLRTLQPLPSTPAATKP